MGKVGKIAESLKPDRENRRIYCPVGFLILYFLMRYLKLSQLMPSKRAAADTTEETGRTPPIVRLCSGLQMILISSFN